METENLKWSFSWWSLISVWGSSLALVTPSTSLVKSGYTWGHTILRPRGGQTGSSSSAQRFQAHVSNLCHTHTQVVSADFPLPASSTNRLKTMATVIEKNRLDISTLWVFILNWAVSVLFQPLVGKKKAIFIYNCYCYNCCITVTVDSYS